MNFETQLPEWKNKGTEPSDDLQTNGFKEGYKPPAGVFNWFWSLVSKATKEIQEKISKTTPNIVVNAVRELTDDGKEIYVVNDSNITELYNGLEITIIPNEKNTTSSPRLKINDFGDNGIRLPLSFNVAATTTIEANYFQVDRPITLKYHSALNLGIQGQGAWLFADRIKTSAQDLYGDVPIESGGTGASTVEEALENLGIDAAGLFFADASNPKCLYRMVDDEKEWLNPPMKNKVEYRTTERFNGAPVYVQLVDFTTAAVGNYVAYFIANTEDDQGLFVTDISGVLLDEQDHAAFYPFPVITDNGTVAATASIVTQSDQDSTSWYLHVNTISNLVAQYPAQICIKYTK